MIVLIERPVEAGRADGNQCENVYRIVHRMN